MKNRSRQAITFNMHCIFGHLLLVNLVFISWLQNPPSNSIFY